MRRVYTFLTASLLTTALLVSTLLITYSITSLASDVHEVGLGIMLPRKMSIDDSLISFKEDRRYVGHIVVIHEPGKRRVKLKVPKGANVEFVINIANYEEVLRKFKYSALWINPEDPYPTIVNFPVTSLKINDREYCVGGCVIKKADLRVEEGSLRIHVVTHVLKEPRGLTTLVIDGKSIINREVNNDDIRLEIIGNEPYEFGIEFNATADGVTAANAWVQGMGHAYVNGAEVPVFAILGLAFATLSAFIAWGVSHLRITRDR